MIGRDNRRSCPIIWRGGRQAARIAQLLRRAGAGAEPSPGRGRCRARHPGEAAIERDAPARWSPPAPPRRSGPRLRRCCCDSRRRCRTRVPTRGRCTTGRSRGSAAWRSGPARSPAGSWRNSRRAGGSAAGDGRAAAIVAALALAAVAAVSLADDWREPARPDPPVRAPRRGAGGRRRDPAATRAGRLRCALAIALALGRQPLQLHGRQRRPGRGDGGLRVRRARRRRGHRRRVAAAGSRRSRPRSPAAPPPFLAFNVPPARMFMGDVGAVPLGFPAAALGALGIALGRWPAWFPVLVFLPFVADATVTLARRALAGERVFEAHRGHYYQRLWQLGAGHRGTLAVYAALMRGDRVDRRRPARRGSRGTVCSRWPPGSQSIAAGFAAIDYHWRLHSSKSPMNTPSNWRAWLAFAHDLARGRARVDRHLLAALQPRRARAVTSPTSRGRSRGSCRCRPRSSSRSASIAACGASRASSTCSGSCWRRDSARC